MKRNQRSLGERDFGWFFMGKKQASPGVWRRFGKEAFYPRRSCLKQLS
jgi:hypothetical protein